MIPVKSLREADELLQQLLNDDLVELPSRTQNSSTKRELIVLSDSENDEIPPMKRVKQEPAAPHHEPPLPVPLPPAPHFQPTPQQDVIGRRILQTYLKHPTAVDTSDMGTGKTFLACHVARLLNFKGMIVIGPPASELGTWEKTTKLANLEMFFVGQSRLSGAFKRRVKVTGLEDEVDVDFIENLHADDDENVLKEETVIRERGPSANGLLERTDLVTTTKITRMIKIYYKNPDRQPVVKDITSVTHRVVTSYEPLDKLVNMLRGRSHLGHAVLLVMDEAHFAKNDSITSKAAQAMTLAVEGTPSKVLLLSGTLMDKLIQAKQFCRLLLLYRHPKLYYLDANGNVKLTSSQQDGTLIKYGLQELLDSAAKFDAQDQAKLIIDKALDPIAFVPDEADAVGVIRKKGSKATNMNVIIWNLWTQVFSPHLLTSMLPIDLREKQDLASLYLFFHDVGLRQEFGQRLARLDQAIRMWAAMRGKKNAVEMGEVMGQITPSLRAIEVLKAQVLVEKIVKVLKENPNTKVIVFLTYQDAFKVLDRGLRQALEVGPNSPLILQAHGELSVKTRDTNYQRFNLPNLNCRVLLASLITSSTSISLHDTDGRFPRYSFIIPSWSAINIAQAARRTIRLGLQSVATVRTIYGNCEGFMRRDEVFAPRHENRLLACLARKTLAIDSNRNFETQECFPLPSNWIDRVEQQDGTEVEMQPVEFEELDFAEFVEGPPRDPDADLEYERGVVGVKAENVPLQVKPEQVKPEVKSEVKMEFKSEAERIREARLRHFSQSPVKQEFFKPEPHD